MDKPILQLFTELGRAETDRVTLNTVKPGAEWTPHIVQAQGADALAAAFTAASLNVYMSVNPVEGVVQGRGDASQVVGLSALWVDLDLKPSGMGTVEKANNLIDSLSAILGTRPTAVVDSGGGLQPYWAIEEAHVSDINRNYMIGILKRWGYLVKRFAGIEGGKVDSVFDLPRVLRAPGTLNFKYDPPVPTTVSFEQFSHPLSIEQIDEILQEYGYNSAVEDDALVLVPPSQWEPATRDCIWAQALASEIDRSPDPASRHQWLLGKATKINVAARNGCITEETYGELVQLLDAKFMDILSRGNPPRKAAPGEVKTAFKWTQDRVSTFPDVKMADNLDYHTHKAALYAVPDLPKESPQSGNVIPIHTAGALALAPDFNSVVMGEQNFQFSDAANSERLARAAMGSHIFVPGLGWHVWRKGRYTRDVSNSIVRLAIQTSKDFASEQATKEATDWARKSMSAPAVASAIRLAEAVPEMVVLPTSLDSLAEVLCTPGGVVNLREGTIAEASPLVDLHTRQTKVTPASGPMPMFTKFLNMIFQGDQEAIDYVQELMGIALIGEVRYQILPIFVGPGANGKSTILNIAAGCLGDYAAIMPENFLLEGGKLEHSTEIFRLRGVRLAIGSETRPDGKFNESRVKMLTGEKLLSARRMREDFIDFIATHTLFLALNHPPTVNSGGDGFWRRIQMLLFGYQVPVGDRDPDLDTKIVEQEGPQVLNWMIEGSKRVMAQGLTVPQKVTDTTAIYREEEDHISAFLTDCCDPNPEAIDSSVAIFGSYLGWCKKNGHVPISSVGLFRELRQRLPLTPTKMRLKSGSQVRGWKGLLVYANEE